MITRIAHECKGLLTRLWPVMCAKTVVTQAGAEILRDGPPRTASHSLAGSVPRAPGSSDAPDAAGSPGPEG